MLINGASGYVVHVNARFHRFSVRVWAPNFVCPIVRFENQFLVYHGFEFCALIHLHPPRAPAKHVLAWFCYLVKPSKVYCKGKFM